MLCNSSSKGRYGGFQIITSGENFLRALNLSPQITSTKLFTELISEFFLIVLVAIIERSVATKHVFGFFFPRTIDMIPEPLPIVKRCPLKESILLQECPWLFCI